MGLAVAGQSNEAAGEAAAQHVYHLVSQLGLPQRLRDVGVKKADLPRLAQLALKSSAVLSNPKPLTEASQVEAVFRAAW